MTEIARHTDEATGLECRIWKQKYGHLCGYVGLPEGHPLFGKNYDDVDAEVHGGLTYAGTDLEPETKLWWLGFDCAHSGDVVPGIRGFDSEDGYSTYKDEAYVFNELTSLAKQLARPRQDSNL